MKQTEFNITDDGICLHMKLDMPDIPIEAKCPLVVLFHGFTGHMEEPHLLAVTGALVKRGTAVLRTDLYGHGKSGGTFREHTILKWLNNAIAVTDYARKLPFVRSLHVCGHSQGGLLAILLGAAEPEIYQSMILLSPAVNIPADAQNGKLLGQSFDQHQIPEVIGIYEEMELGGNYARIARMIDSKTAAGMFPGEVLLIHGTDDESVPFRCSEAIAPMFQMCRLCSIKDDTHCYDRHVDQVAEAVVTFLSPWTDGSE